MRKDLFEVIEESLTGAVQTITLPQDTAGISMQCTESLQIVDPTDDAKLFPSGGFAPNAIVIKNGLLSNREIKVKGSGTLSICCSKYQINPADEYGNSFIVVGGGDSNSPSGGFPTDLITGQITLTSTPQQLSSETKGGYLAIRCTGEAFIGKSTVTSTTGLLCNDDNGYYYAPVADISKKYVVGTGTLYFELSVV